MSAQRKTFSVEVFKEYVNNVLAVNHLSQEFKRGLTLAVEHVLMASGNYKGFKHNYWESEGFKKWQESGKPDFPEKSAFIGPEYDRTYY